jgi:trans-L-3-hydroxyproline dehydratase
VHQLDQTIKVPGIGALRYDIAFGGAYYAFVKAEDLEIELIPDRFQLLIDLGMRIKRAVMAEMPIQHPFEADLGFLYGVIFTAPTHDPSHHSRNVCIFAEGEVDRSPTGTGVSARAALHFARGEISLNQPFTVESILGTTFTTQVVETTQFGKYPAVIPQVTGSAVITGLNRWVFDPSDPLGRGFIFR